jgi:hypothetical protein
LTYVNYCISSLKSLVTNNISQTKKNECYANKCPNHTSSKIKLGLVSNVVGWCDISTNWTALSSTLDIVFLYKKNEI